MLNCGEQSQFSCFIWQRTLGSNFTHVYKRAEIRKTRVGMGFRTQGGCKTYQRINQNEMKWTKLDF